MACVVMTCILVGCIVTARILMAYAVMAYTALACIVDACIVMSYSWRQWFALLRAAFAPRHLAQNGGCSVFKKNDEWTRHGHVYEHVHRQ